VVVAVRIVERLMKREEGGFSPNFKKRQSKEFLKFCNRLKS
jgi:hypothetical protein